MKMVKIISGAYGHNKHGSIEVKNRQSEPFALDDIKAQELVDEGFAVIVGEAVDSPAQGVSNLDPSNNPTTPTSSAEGDSDDGAEDTIPQYNVDTNVNELRSIAKTYCDGMTFPAGTTKAEMVAAIDEYLGVSSDGGELDLSAADPE